MARVRFGAEACESSNAFLMALSSLFLLILGGISTKSDEIFEGVVLTIGFVV